MNISGIRPYAGFYEYNSIKNEAPVVDSLQLQEEPQVAIPETPVEQNYSSYDFAQTYRPGEVYDLKGADSDIESLDMQKAVSDLDKDQVLRQYQYFVGSRENVTKTSIESTQMNMRSGENFSL